MSQTVPQPETAQFPAKKQYLALSKEQRKQFLKDVITYTGKDYFTVLRWLRGATSPSLIEKKLVVECFNVTGEFIPALTLTDVFPNKKTPLTAPAND